MGAFEAPREKWSMLADVIFLNVGVNGGGTVPVPFAPGLNIDGDGNASVKTQGWVLDLIGRYNYRQSPIARIDLLARARYQGLQLDFGLGIAARLFRTARG